MSPTDASGYIISQLEKDIAELNQRLIAKNEAFLEAQARSTKLLREAQDAINKSLAIGGEAGRAVLVRYKQSVGELD